MEPYEWLRLMKACFKMLKSGRKLFDRSLCEVASTKRGRVL